jgi:hypothetical protein
MNTLTLTSEKTTGGCPHTPPCPPRTAPDAQSAKVAIDHPEQGWSLLCNGLILIDHEPLTGGR